MAQRGGFGIHIQKYDSNGTEFGTEPRFVTVLELVCCGRVISTSKTWCALRPRPVLKMLFVHVVRESRGAQGL